MEDCDCKNTRQIYKEEFDFSQGVGENVFEFEDIFKNIKNYYQNYEGEEGEEGEDLLLDSLVPKKDKSDSNFINELLNIIEDEKMNKEEDIEEEKEEDIEEENISINLNNNIKEKKIKYIKDYLKKLKDGY
jgi:hypothetical protein